MIAKERNTFYIDLYNFKIAMWLLYNVYLCINSTDSKMVAYKMFQIKTD